MEQPETRETRPLIGDVMPRWYQEQVSTFELDTKAKVVGKRVRKLLKAVISMAVTTAVIATMVLFAKGWYDEEDLFVGTFHYCRRYHS